MNSTLLTLTSHLSGKTLREDAMFKKSSLESSLISSECLGKGSDIPTNLRPLKGKDGTGVTYGDVDGTQQVTFIDVGLPAWQLPSFTSRESGRSEFEKWLGGKIESLDDCQCLLLCGHHSMFQGVPLIWGREGESRYVGQYGHNPFTAFYPSKSDDNRPLVEVRGSADKIQFNPVRRAGPFDCTKALKNCRLIIIVGCNGIGGKGGPATPAMYWQSWASLANDAGKKPIVLGWYGKIGAPKDRYPTETFSQPFWKGMKDLAGGSDIKTLCENEPAKVIKLWGCVLKTVYGKSHQRLLWYGGDQGAGALDPSGKVWRVKTRNGEIEVVS